MSYKLKPRVRHLLIAFVVVVVVSNIVGFIAGLTRSPELGDYAAMVGMVSGVITFFNLHLRAANRRVAEADAGTRSQALAFRCPPGRALIYIVRTGLAAKGLGVNILVDGKTVTQLRTPRFAVVELAPGTHQLVAQIGAGDSTLSGAGGQISISLAAGSVTVLQVGMKFGLLKSKWTFEPWSLDDAKSKLRSIAMVQAEVPTA